LKFYEITIRPLSGFGTSLKGDTIFGHFCWQVAYHPSMVNGGLEQALAVYDHSPFAIFSSVFPKFEKEKTHYIFKRPDIPLSWMFPMGGKCREDHYKNVKEYKMRKWMVLDTGLKIDFTEIRFLNDIQILKEAVSITTPETQKVLEESGASDFIIHLSQPHNSINRLTGSTGAGDFAPYAKENLYYYPETELALFVLLDDNMTNINLLIEGLEKIGRFGFGRDASIGLGRFEICGSDEIKFPDIGDANACYSLAPCVPEKDRFEKTYFSPFIRYGKHGDRLANAGNPFKNPVIMTDEGAVFIPKNRSVFDKPYIGRAVTDVSKAEAGCVVQGYAPYLPLRLEH
jgi:CRISPR-associated protein Csm4